jgi:ryanodine receptor 2
LFSKALPCLSAIGCALSPDYSYKVTKEQNVVDNLDLIGFKRGPFISQPINTAPVTLSNDFEEIIKIYSEHAHDYWCIKRVRFKANYETEQKTRIKRNEL